MQSALPQPSPNQWPEHFIVGAKAEPRKTKRKSDELMRTVGGVLEQELIITDGPLAKLKQRLPTFQILVARASVRRDP